MKKSLRLLTILILLLPACSKDPNVKDLEQAARAVEQMVSPFYADRSSFFVVLPNGTPRQFVSWFFSSMGTAEWPPVDQPSEFSSDEIDAMRSSGMVLLPAGVTFRHSRPDTAAQRQIVLKWDDAEGTVILEGYLDPTREPIVVKSFKLPKGVVPDDFARAVTQSNLELGMKFQSF